MSGTDIAESAVLLVRLQDVLSRQSPIDSLQALQDSLARKSGETPPLSTVALGLDSSVFLRLGRDKHGADVVDYLGSRHAGPLILPGQAIQEFWNNQLSVVHTIAASLRMKFEALAAEADKVDDSFAGYSQRLQSLLQEFTSDYGFVYDEGTVRDVSSVLDVLRKRSAVFYVPRLMFHELALHRKRTKTPPGFKDDGDGDFFVWAEFLFGLLETARAGSKFEHAVLVTQDRKADWSRGGVAHPILSAEVRELTGASFEVWTLDQLSAAVLREVTEGPSA